MFELDEDVARINLLYNTGQERIDAETATTIVAFTSAVLAARSSEIATALAIFDTTAAQVEMVAGARVGF